LRARKGRNAGAKSYLMLAPPMARKGGTGAWLIRRANHHAPTGDQTFTLTGAKVRFHHGVDPTAPGTGSRVKLHGKIYVDDLSTLPQARRRGHAWALLDWLLEEADRLGLRPISSRLRRRPRSRRRPPALSERRHGHRLPPLRALRQGVGSGRHADRRSSSKSGLGKAAVIGQVFPSPTHDPAGARDDLAVVQHQNRTSLVPLSPRTSARSALRLPQVHGEAR
jgi:GNAT superfamily N-acetyltransferase